MLADDQIDKNKVDTGISAEHTDALDAQMVGGMRLLLAVSAFLAVFIDPSGLTSVAGDLGWLVFCGYVSHSLVVYVSSRLNQEFAQSRLIHWLDVVWFALIVLCTDGVQSFFFLFFLFAVLTSSFQWGFEEGARVTVASAVLFAASGLGSVAEPDLARLLLRTTFLLTLGYMSAHWGGSKLDLRRRLALLRDVSRLSNPRFGMDHTVTRVLEKTQSFFGASSCILVLHDKDSGTFTLRAVGRGTAMRTRGAEKISEEIAFSLMDSCRNQIVAYRRRGWPAFSSFAKSALYDSAQKQWFKDLGQASERLGEILEAQSFVSSPISLRRRQGRIYVLSSHTNLSKADALFLNHIAAQVFPVIDNIELLDRMVSTAASQERRKIALDIHDTAIQPYIGLKLGLSALRHRAAADNPLVEDLDRLVGMATKVIDDLRRYAGSVRADTGDRGKMLHTILRQRAAQVRDFYGIDVAVEIAGDVNVNDRLTAEVLQIVQEGLNNVCKHTSAQRASVDITFANGILIVEISNDRNGVPLPRFTPRSISERAEALEGRARVQEARNGGTAVRVEIPI